MIVTVEAEKFHKGALCSLANIHDIDHACFAGGILS